MCIIYVYNIFSHCTRRHIHARCVCIINLCVYVHEKKNKKHPELLSAAERIKKRHY